MQAMRELFPEDICTEPIRLSILLNKIKTAFDKLRFGWIGEFGSRLSLTSGRVWPDYEKTYCQLGASTVWCLPNKDESVLKRYNFGGFSR